MLTTLLRFEDCLVVLQACYCLSLICSSTSQSVVYCFINNVSFKWADDLRYFFSLRWRWTCWHSTGSSTVVCFMLTLNWGNKKWETSCGLQNASHKDIGLKLIATFQLCNPEQGLRCRKTINVKRKLFRKMKRIVLDYLGYTGGSHTSPLGIAGPLETK